MGPLSKLQKQKKSIKIFHVAYGR